MPDFLAMHRLHVALLAALSLAACAEPVVCPPADSGVAPACGNGGEWFCDSSLRFPRPADCEEGRVFCGAGEELYCFAADVDGG